MKNSDNIPSLHDLVIIQTDKLFLNSVYFKCLGCLCYFFVVVVVLILQCLASSCQIMLFLLYLSTTIFFVLSRLRNFEILVVISAFIVVFMTLVKN